MTARTFTAFTILVASLDLALAACSEVDSGVDAPPPLDGASPDSAFEHCPLAVNEVAAAGDPEDWIELLNIGDASIDLAGFMFSDEADDPAHAAPLPASMLAPGDRHVEEVTDGDEGFQLGAADAVWLYRVGTTVHCDGVVWRSGDSPAGGSYSRIPDGVGPWQTTTPDTRGVPNQ
ncbi:MAG TPA: lamin tail domain-containing protein [Kofleriaceae bacterium]|nr:lamin tail domain-containing protein [Kofleriaceae bacterium]